MMKIFKTLTFISVLAIVFPVFAGNDSQTALFQQANAAYESGDYQHAVELYNSIVDNGFDGWELRYNMGNAYYRLDEIGHSILNYERALRLAPGKKVIKDNLALARSHTTDNIEELPKLFLWEWAQSVSQMFTLNGWLIIIALLFLLGCAALGVFLISTEYKTRKTALIVNMVLILLIVFSAAGATISSINASKDNEAIITEPLVVVKGSPDFKGVDKFVLHEGTKLTINDIQDDWWQIEIADGKSGWINSGAEII